MSSFEPFKPNFVHIHSCMTIKNLTYHTFLSFYYFTIIYLDNVNFCYPTTLTILNHTFLLYYLNYLAQILSFKNSFNQTFIKMNSSLTLNQQFAKNTCYTIPLLKV